MQRVLIVGGAGFIGSHLAARCLQEGAELHIAARPSTNHWRLASFLDELQIHRVQLVDNEAVGQLLDRVRPDIVYYLASTIKPRQTAEFSDVFESIQDGIVALLNTLNAASKVGVRKFVRAATIAEYGAGPVPFDESQRELPVNTYAASMTAATHYVQMLQRRLPFPVLHARLALTYGPRQSQEFLIPNTITKCLAKQPVMLQHPNDRRDLIYIDDVVDALLQISASALPGGTILNIGSGNAPAMRDVVREIAHLCGMPPNLITVANSDEADSPPQILHCATARAEALLGWRARTALQAGLRKTIDTARHAPDDQGRNT